MKAETYLQRPYHIELIQGEDRSQGLRWVASVEELPGCIAQGDTPEQAVARVRDVMESWIEFVLERGEQVPEPRPEPSCSGRILMRLPRTLHERLLAEARREGVSLNQYVMGICASAVSWKSTVPVPTSKGLSAARRTAEPRTVHTSSVASHS